MRIMVIGGGGREHALIRKLKESPKAETIYCLPGNGGIAQDAVCVGISATDIDGMVAFAKENAIDYAVVAPDDPLVLGAVDALEAAGVPCFGPSRAAARIEGSKSFAKNLMKKYGIPTASYQVFDDLHAALAYIDTCPMPAVVKADGLALGKGVVIAQTREEARSALTDMMQNGRFGKSGETVVIEEFLTGPEVSVLCFTDGKTLMPMASSMDHKRIGDGDVGPNTGGMGTIAPNPYYTGAVADRCMQEIFLPTIRAMAAEGCPFKGCLYFGLMLTPDGPRVIEYNCRFGDPETQVVLPLLDADLLEVMQAVTRGELSEVSVGQKPGFAACVVMASPGYPGSAQKGIPLSIPASILPHVYVAGAAVKDGQMVTSGGRVLGVTATGESLESALALAYERVDEIEFPGAQVRRDIGKRALEA